MSFRREKFVPKGGPDGGDGGDGGDVILRADNRLTSLESLESRRMFRAQNGGQGRGAKRHGRDGRDLVIKVPPGTLVKDDERGHVLRDLASHGSEVVIAVGGKGGKGNVHFASATERTPQRAGPAGPGDSRRLHLELKLIADVGLIGFPNAGKSTLLKCLSSAKPKVGAYPFTTLTPNIGVLEVDYEDYVIADVPGLIEGAHKGKGLGDRFLRHVERTRLLLHLVDAAGEQSPLEAYRAVRKEIDAYGGELADRGEIVVLTKADLLKGRREPVLEMEQAGVPVFLVSSVSGEGSQDLVEALVVQVERARKSGESAS